MSAKAESTYIPRPQLLERMLQFRNTPEIKVLIGVRRCGKSTALAMLADTLRSEGVPERNLFYRRLDGFDIPIGYNADALQRDLQEAATKADPTQAMTVMLDEIQDIEGWEMVVRRLNARPSTDVYITGSNANLLSSDLATYLTGRYVEIPVYPLSFKEYCRFLQSAGPTNTAPTTGGRPAHGDNAEKRAETSADGEEASRQHQLDEYLRFGGMPGLFALKERTPETIGTQLQAIYDSIVFKDVAQRNNIRDLVALEKVSRFLFATSGSLFSTRKVLNTLKSAGEPISATSLNNYLDGLEKSFLIYRAEQADLTGKALLRPQNKFYPVDIGLRNLTNDFSSKDLGSRLECAVYMELRRRGYRVSVGTERSAEIDFVATKPEFTRMEKTYVQVTASLIDEATAKRELAPLRRLTDAFPRKVITLDPYSTGTTKEGIEVVNALEWLEE